MFTCPAFCSYCREDAFISYRPCSAEQPSTTALSPDQVYLFSYCEPLILGFSLWVTLGTRIKICVAVMSLRDLQPLEIVRNLMIHERIHRQRICSAVPTSVQPELPGKLQVFWAWLAAERCTCFTVTLHR